MPSFKYLFLQNTSVCAAIDAHQYEALEYQFETTIKIQANNWKFPQRNVPWQSSMLETQ